MRCFITDFSPFLSEICLGQKESQSWLSNYHGEKSVSLFEKYAVGSDYIETRHLYAPGIVNEAPKNESLYHEGETGIPTLEKRAESAQLFLEGVTSSLYRERTIAPDHINHISCTHYESPSVAQKLVNAKEWFDDTNVTHLYHMGCYAALPAIRIARAYLSEGAKQVENLHTELCSFHLNKETSNPEQTIMKTLFADGVIRYSVVDESVFVKEKLNGLEILAQREVMVPGTENEMTWRLTSVGFAMTLTKKVPLVLAKGIKKYMQNLFADVGLDFENDKDKVIFAIHPGGPKIIQLIQKVLDLSEFQVSHSRKILKARGNMSSATIPYIWNEIIDDDMALDQTFVATVAFGPGLTMTGAMLKICKV